MRVLAFALDYLVIAAYLIVVVGAGVVLRFAAPETAVMFFGNATFGQVSGFVLITLPITLYFAIGEASCRRATWGKRRLGLMVTDVNEGRLSLGRSLVRTVLRFLPWELAHTLVWRITFAEDPSSSFYTFGFITVWLMVIANIVSLLMSPRRQTVYDRIARTRVVRRTPT